MANFAYQVTKGAYQGTQYKAYQGSVDLPPAGGGGYHPSQGLPPSVHARAKTKEQTRKERELYGLLPKVEQVLESVAESQVSRLELDQQKQYEELTRELELQGISFESRYLEILANIRESLIEAEIKDRFKRINEEGDVLTMLMAIASVV